MRLAQLILPSILALGLAAPANAGTLSVLKCRGEHGEPVYTSRAQCPGAASALAVHAIEAPVATASPTPPEAATRTATRARPARSPRPPRPEASSWRCQSGSAVWYQHQPCSAGGHKGGGRDAVRGERIARRLACREISRPAAALRKGRERDERTEPYARALGRDPCR